ncbi:ATP-grasp domain-containing protein [bacterium]|nr:ATP-grasp domain-containing protein [bacterium]
MSRPSVGASSSSIAPPRPQTIFVSEYLCSGAWPGECLDSSLAAEGRAMLITLLRDLLRPDGGFFRANRHALESRNVDVGASKSKYGSRETSPQTSVPHSTFGTPHSTLVHTTWDDRLGEFPWSDFGVDVQERLTILPVARSAGVTPDEELVLFRREATAADAVFVIAPEFFGILESRTREIERLAPGRLIGCSSDAVRLCADKLALAEFLPTIGVSTIETHPFDPQQSTVDWPFPIVIKPRDGAGSTLTFRVDSAEELADVAALLRENDEGFAFIQQPFVRGRSLSGAALVSRQLPSEVSCTTGSASVPEASGTGTASGTRQLRWTAAEDVSTVRDRDFAVLPTGEQCLTDDRRFHYRGCEFPGAATQREQQLAEQIIRRCCESIPGLGGYVGFDLISSPDGVRLVEINPRLTTSWAIGRMSPPP